MKISKKSLLKLFGLLLFFGGIGTSKATSETLGSELKSLLGDQYQKTNIETIYVAGPGKTYTCT